MPVSTTVILKDVRNSGAKVTAFELLINETFPDPEIIRVDFQMSDDLTEIIGLKVKVKVTGDFLDDEWFWADFLKYFRLKTYFVPDITNTENAGFFDISLFDESKLPAKNVRPIRKKVTDRVNSYNMLELNSKSNKLSNIYIFEGVAEFSAIAIRQLTDARNIIVARTYFDMDQYAKEMLPGLGKIALAPLLERNNGKWDMIQFITDDKNNFKRVDRFYHYFYNITPEYRWDGPFNKAGDGWTLATAWASINKNVSKLATKREKYNAQNVSDIQAQKIILAQQIADAQQARKDAIDAARKRKQAVDAKVEEISSAFSNLFIGIRLSNQDPEANGTVSLTFSFDYLKLVKNLLSKMPKSIWGFVELMSPHIIRTINVVDLDKKTTGVYKYEASISFRDRTKIEVARINTMINRASSALKVMLTALGSKPIYTDSNTGEITDEFQQVDDYGNIEAAYYSDFVKGFLDVLDYNPLNFFAFETFSIFRTRVKSEKNLQNYELNTPSVEIVRLEENEDTEELSKIGGNGFFEEITPPNVYNIDAFSLVQTTRKDMEDALDLKNATVGDLLSKQALLSKASNFYNNLVNELNKNNNVSMKASIPKPKITPVYKIPFLDTYNADDKKTATGNTFENFDAEVASNIPNTKFVNVYANQYTDQTVRCEIKYLKQFEAGSPKAPQFVPVVDLKPNSETIGTKVLCKLSPQSSMNVPFYFEYFIGTISQLTGEETPPPEPGPGEGGQEKRPVRGCTNPEALNYNEEATEDDGSCVLPLGNTGTNDGSTSEPGELGLSGGNY